MQNVLIQLTLHLNLVQINASFENNVPNFLILYVEIKTIINEYNRCTMITWASLLFTVLFLLSMMFIKCKLLQFIFH